MVEHGAFVETVSPLDGVEAFLQPPFTVAPGTG
jgi:hypothetical protein